MRSIILRKGSEKKVKYNFPENLYTDVRIEKRKSACFVLEDEDVKTNSEVETITAMIRVFDGKMWYTSQTDDIENIQDKIDNLATLAKPNPKILKNPIVKNLGECKESVLVFTGKRDLRNLTAEDRENIVPEIPAETPHADAYATTLPASGIYFRYVKGLSLHNVNVQTLEEDKRDTMVFDNVEFL